MVSGAQGSFIAFRFVLGKAGDVCGSEFLIGLITNVFVEAESSLDLVAEDGLGRLMFLFHDLSVVRQPPVSRETFGICCQRIPPFGFASSGSSSGLLQRRRPAHMT